MEKSTGNLFSFFCPLEQTLHTRSLPLVTIVFTKEFSACTMHQKMFPSTAMIFSCCIIRFVAICARAEVEPLQTNHIMGASWVDNVRKENKFRVCKARLDGDTCVKYDAVHRIDKAPFHTHKAICSLLSHKGCMMTCSA